MSKANRELLEAENLGDSSGVRTALAAAAGVGDRRLFAAAKRGDGRELARMLERGASPMARGALGMTALMAAVGGGHVECALMLARGGCELDAKDERGWTALMEAVDKGHAKCVDALIEAGACVDEQRPDGCTALMLALRKNNAALARRMMMAECDVNLALEGGIGPLALAAAGLDPFMCEDLVDAGASLEALDSKGRTALMRAAIAGRAGHAKFLLEAGCDAGIRDQEGFDALDHARRGWGRGAERECLISALEAAALREAVVEGRSASAKMRI